jgi:hypothetical protein
MMLETSSPDFIAHSCVFFFSVLPLYLFTSRTHTRALTHSFTGAVAFISAADIPAGGSNHSGEVVADEEVFASKARRVDHQPPTHTRKSE